MARTAPVFLAAALLAGALNGAERPSRFDRKLLESHVEFLASDELEGRGNGTTGLELAASYIAGQFEALGLSAVGDESTYFQRFQVSIGHRLAKPPRAVLRVSGQTRELGPGVDFEPLTFSAPGDVSAAVVFAGYGVSAPEHDYDDYAAIDVRGKIALLLRYAPGGFDERGWHATFVRKTRVAASHGALGAIIVNGPRHRRDDELVPFGVDVGAERMPIPVVHMRREHVEWALQANGSDLRGLQKRIDASRTPASSPLEGVEITLSIDIERTSA
ncbi:MAG TPA: PA domain-containing protein, partial [Vicinamibacteria bacterium]|nr:PA domain-containing protein [Vicinamibacteria bacterium]